MAKVRIDVTAEDIAGGVACQSSRCPVARAMARALGGMVLVCANAAQYDGRTIRLPVAVALFIEYFDLGGPVNPFGFEVELPD